MREQLTEYEKGYIEGVIDTDGSLSLSRVNVSDCKRGWRPQVEMSVDNNSLKVLDKVQDILRTDLKPIQKVSGDNYKLGFRTNVLRWLLPQIKLVIKEERRKVILDYLKLANEVTYTWSNHIEELENLFNKWDMVKNKGTTDANHKETDYTNEDKELTDYGKGFIEAVIDMDGNIRLYRNSGKGYKRGWVPKTRLTVYNNSVKLLNKIQGILGTNKNIIGKKHHQISFGINTLKWLLPQLDLIVKKKEQDIIIDYLNFRKKDYNQYSEDKEKYEDKLKNLIERFKN